MDLLWPEDLEAIPEVMVDSGRLKQVLINLLSNALKFTKEGHVHVGVERGFGSVAITVEDTGIVLGNCFREALGNKAGIVRYGFWLLPMDETLAEVALDLSGRSFLSYHAPEGVEAIGGVNRFSYQLVEEFLRAFSSSLLATLHVEIRRGRDAHHMAEAIFKGLARALDAATKHDPRVTGIPSTKDVL